MLKVGITGANGYIGRELRKRHPETFISLVCDVTRPQEVEMEIKNRKPDLVLHLASVSNVDTCEDPKNKEWVMDVNVGGTYNVAESCLARGIGMVLLSTAQVFSGRWWAGYRENDSLNPVNWYGWTKMGAERLRIPFPFMKIVRTSYLFDINRMAIRLENLGRKNVETHPTFIARSFMYLPHFVDSLHEYLCKFEQMPSILHISGTKTVSWYDFMLDVVREYEYDEGLIIAKDKDEQTQAPRPHRVGLNVNHSKRLQLPQHSYLEGIKEMAHA